MRQFSYLKISTYQIFLLIALSFFSISAYADGHITTIVRGPCTIRIISVDRYFKGTSPLISGNINTEQSRADNKKVKDALSEALAASDDMQTKVDEACTEHGNTIDIYVYRNSPLVDYGSAASGSKVINIDLADIESIADRLSSRSQEAIDTVANAKLTRTLAHEFDHMRGADHKDPAGEAAGLETGPAVDDENNVISEMDFPYHKRTFYAAAFEGRSVSSYWVDTDGDGLGDTSVTWLPFEVVRIAGASSSHLLPNNFKQIATAWPPIINADGDLDSIADINDNCPDLVNPQQGPDCVFKK